MGEVPGCVVPVLGAVLAERREGNTVLQGEGADFDRGEKFGNGCAIGLGLGGCPGRRVLGGGKVGDLYLLEMGRE